MDVEISRLEDMVMRILALMDTYNSMETEEKGRARDYLTDRFGYWVEDALQ